MPRAETEQDRRNQTEIADCVCKANAARYDGYIWLSEMLYRVDGCLFKWRDYDFFREPKLFFEAKQRTFPFRGYPDYQISLGKIMAARWLKDATGCHVALFARFADGIVAGVDITKHDGLIIAGRPPRDGFPHDIEPMARLDWDRFKIIRDPRPDGGA